MKKTMMAASILFFSPLGAALSAHDTVTPHASRGECERALAQINNDDRKAAKPGSKEGGYSMGDVNRYFHARFKCEKVDNEWFIIDNFPEDGE